jgi:predicted dinucleotide-binding enzyme
MVMIIGMIGSGNIGSTLGKHWAKAGHHVLFSSRHPEELNQLVVEIGSNVKACSIKEVFEADADVYVLAMPFYAIDKLSELYAGEYADTTIIDVTNPYPQRDGDMAKEVLDANYNASEYTAMKFGTAKTAKAFNTIPADDLDKFAFNTREKVAIPYAAQDEMSKKISEQLITDIGFEPVYIGNLSDSKIMDTGEDLYGQTLPLKEINDKIKSLRQV